MSSSEGNSVNDGIQESRCSLAYVTVEDVTRGIVNYGTGTLLIKIDIRNAYRVVPVHPDDRWLMGMLWEGSLFIDTALPFGLRSAPKIFTALADAAEWIVRQRGVEFVIHYLDDFLIVTSADTNQGEHALRILLESFEQLGLPVAWEKLEGPSTCLTFLGFELDTKSMETRLPNHKLEEVRREVQLWMGRKSATRKELESVVGKLAHVSRVVKPGKTFLRHLFELLSVAQKAHHHVQLGAVACSDLLWWCIFMEQWNGVSIIHHPLVSPVGIWTDASGSFGCGALCPALSRWFQLPWRGTEICRVMDGDRSITWMELLPIVLACAVWGPVLKGWPITVYCDNTGAVALVKSGYSRVPQIMHLLRCLFFFKACYQFSLHAAHVEGVDNVWADAISRNNVDYLHSQVFQAAYQCDPTPEDLVTLLLVEQPDWTCFHWTRLFKDCLRLA